MKFKGDIIITDPCYIMKENKEISNFPERKDFFQYEEPSQYSDVEYCTDLDLEFLKKMDIPLSVFAKSETYMLEEKKYYEAIEKYKKENEDDWEKSMYGSELEFLGFTKYISEDSGGDWSCVTINTDTKEKIGSFCADAGRVGVYLLEEVLEYNPDFDYHITKPHTTTWIKNFDGEINVYWSGGCPSIHGSGNVNFITRE